MDHLRPRLHRHGRWPDPLRQHRGEKLALGKRMLFLDYGDGVADSKLTGAFIERRLGCKGTARNMRSIARIVAKLDEEKKAK